MIKLSQDQKQTLRSLVDWHNSQDKNQYITLGGYAGTGKTTIISLFRNLLHKSNKNFQVSFASYTGKAARVLRSTLAQTKSIYPQDSVSTIHSLIYSPLVNDKEEIIGWDKKDDIKADLIIIDEASMIDRTIWRDLLSYKIPIIAVGDHGQLPPIRENFNLMDNPDLKLEQIHRQAAGNPIIKLSIQARKEGEIETGKFGPGVMKLDRTDYEAKEYLDDIFLSYNENTLVLCGYNLTRIKLNQYIRELLEFHDPNPQPGDRVICLRNNHQKEIYNGMLGKIQRISDASDWYDVKINLDDEKKPYEGLIYKEQFNNNESLNFTEKRKNSVKGDLFDFGYAITVHKAQGSQAKRVVLFEERFKKMDDENWRKWLYTGITRAEKELYIIG